MTEPLREDAVRDTVREVLRELMPEMLETALGANVRSSNGHGDREPDVPEAAARARRNPEQVTEAEPVPRFPAPPVAAVLRPSTWTAPPEPGEVIGDSGQPAGDLGGEPVRIDDDRDLAAFVRALAERMEDPRERSAIRAGQIQFTLRHGQAAAGEPVLRVEKGAVTERTVREAARGGHKLVLARAAVLTPLARDRARALGVKIEKEHH